MMKTMAIAANMATGTHTRRNIPTVTVPGTSQCSAIGAGTEGRRAVGRYSGVFGAVGAKAAGIPTGSPKLPFQAELAGKVSLTNDD